MKNSAARANFSAVHAADEEQEKFYSQFWSADDYWSKPFPNPDQTSRFAKVAELLSDIAMVNEGPRLRILDVGCGRGWLTHLCSAYGECEGVEPVAGAVALARKAHPHLKFHVGTAGDVAQRDDFRPYDVIVCSEVIEHVLDKATFVRELTQCLKPGGFVVLTTPRGEEFTKWRRVGLTQQPIEAWISEKAVARLLEEEGYRKLAHDRAYVDLYDASLLHRLAASTKLRSVLERLSAQWTQKALRYHTAIYQVWLFQRV